MKVRLLVLPIICLGLGCQASYNVGVNGYSSTGRSLQVPRGSSIMVVSDGNAPNPIFEGEIKAKIETLLTEKGYRVQADGADHLLAFDYGIDSGRPVMGVAPHWHSHAYCDYYYSGSYGYGYYTYAPYTEVVYTRWLVMKMFDNKAYGASKKVKPLWIGEIASVGLDSDLRELMNYMLIVGFEYFGEDTGRRVSEVISKNDDRVWLLR